MTQFYTKALRAFIYNALLLGCWLHVYGEVVSTSGNIKFDVDDAGFNEMVLNNTGLGIGDNLQASSKLQVDGNVIVSETLSVGTDTSSTSNLHLSGTLNKSFQESAVTATIGSHSIVLADSSSGTIRLTLPEASTVEGRMMEIKKTALANAVEVVGGGNLDGVSGYRLTSGNLGSLELISASGNWHVLAFDRGQPFHEGIFLFSDFAGVNNDDGTANPTATGVNWNPVVGVDSPSDSLTFWSADGFFNVNENEIDVNRNLASEGSWSTNISLSIPSSTQSVDLTEAVLNWRMINNSGANNSGGTKNTNWSISVFGSTSGNLGVRMSAESNNATFQERTIDLSGFTLTPSETYTLILQASAPGTDWGHNASLQDIAFSGNVEFNP